MCPSSQPKTAKQSQCTWRYLSQQRRQVRAHQPHSRHPLLSRYALLHALPVRKDRVLPVHKDRVLPVHKDRVLPVHKDRVRHALGRMGGSHWWSRRSRSVPHASRERQTI